MYQLRYYQYIDEYLKLWLEYYAGVPNAVPMTYWHYDHDNSVTEQYWDTNAGSYDVVGELSGYRWVKILMLPGFWAEHTAIEPTAAEHSITRENKISVTIPDVFGLVPNTLDFMFFPSRITDGDPTPVFRVIGTNESHFGNKTFYKLNLDTTYIRNDQLEAQTINTYVFIQTENRFYTLDNADVLLKALDYYQKLDGRSNNSNFSNRLGLYLDCS